MGEWSPMIIEVRLRLCAGEVVGVDVLPVLDTLGFATWQGWLSLSYLNGTGILDGRVPPETLRRLIATPVPGVETARSCTTGGMWSYEALLPLMTVSTSSMQAIRVSPWTTVKTYSACSEFGSLRSAVKGGVKTVVRPVESCGSGLSMEKALICAFAS